MAQNDASRFINISNKNIQGNPVISKVLYDLQKSSTKYDYNYYSDRTTSNTWDVEGRHVLLGALHGTLTERHEARDTVSMYECIADYDSHSVPSRSLSTNHSIDFDLHFIPSTSGSTDRNNIISNYIGITPEYEHHDDDLIVKKKRYCTSQSRHIIDSTFNPIPSTSTSEHQNLYTEHNYHTIHRTDYTEEHNYFKKLDESQSRERHEKNIHNSTDLGHPFIDMNRKNNRMVQFDETLGMIGNIPGHLNVQGDTEEHYIGNMDYKCSNCSALHFHGEKGQKRQPSMIVVIMVKCILMTSRIFHKIYNRYF